MTLFLHRTMGHAYLLLDYPAMTFSDVFYLTLIISTCAADRLPSMIGKVYYRRDYNASDPMLAQLATSNRFLCAAQCANQWTSCRTAVYDSSVLLDCRLYSEAMIPMRLIASSNVVVYDFQQNKTHGKIHIYSMRLSKCVKFDFRLRQLKERSMVSICFPLFSYHQFLSLEQNGHHRGWCEWWHCRYTGKFA